MGCTSSKSISSSVTPVSVIESGGDKITSSPKADKPKALIWRDDGPVALYITSDAAKEALQGFEVTFIGPNEAEKALTPELMQQFDLYVQPGGGDDMDACWNVMKANAPIIRDYVSG
jgi:hypothetical protein